MKKKMIIAGLAAAMSLGTCMTSFAGSWQKDDIGWWWQEDDGSYPTNGWKWLDGNQDGIYEEYHFNETGYLDVDTVVREGEGEFASEYTVNADGAWTVDGEVKIKKEGDDLSNGLVPNPDGTVCWGPSPLIDYSQISSGGPATDEEMAAAENFLNYYYGRY